MKFRFRSLIGFTLVLAIGALLGMALILTVLPLKEVFRLAAGKKIPEPLRMAIRFYLKFFARLEAGTLIDGKTAMETLGSMEDSSLDEAALNKLVELLIEKGMLTESYRKRSSKTGSEHPVTA